MIEGKREVGLVLSQEDFLKVLSPDAVGKFCSAREEGIIEDIGGVGEDNIARRTIVGPLTKMGEIFPEDLLKRKAFPVVKASMSQSQFDPQIHLDKEQGVIDIGYVGNQKEQTRTIICTEEQIQKIFPGIKLAP